MRRWNRSVLGLLLLVVGPVTASTADELHAPTAQPPVTRLTLEEARQQALAHNASLLLGQLNVQEKEIAVSAAKRDYFPKVLGLAAYLHFNDDLGTVLATRSRTLGGATIGPGGVVTVPTITRPGRRIAANVINQDSAIGTVMVAQPITKLIAVSALVDIARADQGIASAQLDKGTRELLSGVTQAYYGLLIARRIHTALLLQAGALEALLKVEATPDLRLAFLEVRKGTIEADKQIADLVDLLNQLLGFPPETCLEVIEPPLPPITVSCAAEAVQQALANNPQIREAEQNIAKARAALRIANMDYIPDVNVFGAYVGQSVADYVQPDFGAVGVTATYTFWDWGKRKEVKHQREMQIALATQNVQVVSEAVQLDARKAFQAYKQAEEELGIATEVVKAREDAEKGAKDPVAILTAKAATAKAQLDVMQAELNYRIAHAKLLEVIGKP